jgi:catechol 2,3-dioxygenase-like lactoylglutathione lyase family enzyme
MKIVRSNTILYCERWRETVAFYRDILKLPVGMEKEWFVEFRLTDTAMLSVADTSRATIDTSRGEGITISLRVDNVDQARAALEERGVSPGPLRSIWGSRAFYLHDPEGTRLEFWGP